MINDASEEEAPPCKHRRTRSDEESGEDRSLSESDSDDEPENGITDAALAHAVEFGAPETAPSRETTSPGTGSPMPCWHMT